MIYVAITIALLTVSILAAVNGARLANVNARPVNAPNWLRDKTGQDNYGDEWAHSYIDL